LGFSPGLQTMSVTVLSSPETDLALTMVDDRIRTVMVTE
jgi:hypothetical protein